MFHLIWGRHFTATFRILLICCERSEYGPKNIDVPTELRNIAGIIEENQQINAIEIEI